MPLGLPFRFVPVTDSPGYGLTEDLFCAQKRWYERKAYYQQKWVKTDTTMLQCESSIYPEDMQLIQVNNNIITVVKTFEWDKVFEGINYSIFETVFDVTDVPNGIYFLVSKVIFEDAINWAFMSEPIAINTEWKKTLKLKYKNSFNKDDIAWTTGLEMLFRCEMDINDYEPDSLRTSYINQVQDARLLDGTPGMQASILIGDTPGVPYYIIDILDAIFTNDFTELEGIRIVAKPGEQIKVTRGPRQYRMVGGSLTVKPYYNKRSNQFNDDTELTNAIVTAYNIETGFFGPKAQVSITEVEENG